MRFQKNATKLDALVAEHVIGLIVTPDPKGYRGVTVGTPGDLFHDLPHYSTDMDAAMRVLEKMRTRKHRWLINIDEVGYHVRRVVWIGHNAERNEKTYTADKPLGTAMTWDDLPRVISQAALNEVKERPKALKKKKRKA